MAAVIESKLISKAARLQSAVVSLVKASKDPMTSTDLAQHSSIQSMDLKDNDMYSSLATLVKQGTIRKVHIKRHDQPQARFAYEVGTGGVIRTFAARKRMSAVAAPQRETPQRAAPLTFIGVDLVRSSGKIRITLAGGVSVEIGAVES